MQLVSEYGKHPRVPKVTPQEEPLAFSKWPMGDNEDTEGSGGRPRAATVVIWRWVLRVYAVYKSTWFGVCLTDDYSVNWRLKK